MKYNFDDQLIIFGTGGFGREVLTCLIDIADRRKINIKNYVKFSVDDEYYNDAEVHGIKVIPKSEIDINNHLITVTVGDPKLRHKIVQEFPDEARYANILHPSAVISSYVKYEDGILITAGCILTTDIEIGKHAHLNLQTTIGHDCVIGDYFTTAPAVNVSGNCSIGNFVYLGTKAAIREKITITDNVILGMGCNAVKNIAEPGIYVGSPAKRLEK